MRTIQIDEEVFAHIRSHAIPYEDKAENDTLRRIFGIDGNGQSNNAKDSTANPGNGRDRKKAEKADLRILSRDDPDTVKDGQTLYLHDHRGRRIPGFEAKIVASENRLRWSNKKYSMSKLAGIGLKDRGYKGKVSGPRHWHTADGVSIRELWERAHPEQKIGSN